MSALNDKIRKTIEDNTTVETIEGHYHVDEVDVTGATNALEKLILQGKIDALKEAECLLCRAYGFNHEDMGWDVDFEDWKEKYKELINQLKELS